MASVGAWVSSKTTPLPVLPSYRREPTPLRRLIVKGLFFAIVIALGLFYGFSVVLLPPLLLLYFSLPMLILVAVILWAMPDGGRGPLGFIAFCFFAFNAALVLWPDYMAVQIPGLAWISFRRVWAWSLSAGILLCLAMSNDVRGGLATRMKATKPFWIMAGIYFAMHWLTLPLSRNWVGSLNQALNQSFIWGVPLIAAAFLFDRYKNLRRWELLILLAAAVNCVIGVLEYQNKELLWANHIPGFLTVQDEVLQRILAGAVRDGQYRVTSVFSVSLCLAEFLSFAIPFALRRAFATSHVGRIVLWGIADLVLLGVIVLTNSQLGIIGWLVSHSVFLMLWGLKRWLTKARDLIGPAISLAYPAAAAVFIFAMFTVPAVHNRTIGGGSTGFSDQSRKEQLALFWPKLFHNPIGYGAGQSGEILDYHLPGGMVTVDSYFITVGLDYGALGIICFFGMFIYTFGLMTRTYLTSDTKEAELALPIACAIAVMFFVRLVLSQVDNVPLVFVLFGSAIGLYAHVTNNARSASPTSQPNLARPSRGYDPQLQPAE